MQDSFKVVHEEVLRRVVVNVEDHRYVLTCDDKHVFIVKIKS
jgi:hypothetical protein